jgi:RNA polymerase sigma factor (sigma-70 family)
LCGNTKAMRTDADLLRRADSDPHAFGTFYRRHERAVVAFAGRMLRDPEVTIDVVAETFARAYESRASYRAEEGGARAWLLGIARHVVFASLRRGQVESAARERLGLQALALSEATLSAVEQAVLESCDAVVEAWLADLPPEQRDAVRRRVLEDAEYAEIAGELECSQAVVRQRVSRGLAALRRDVMEER